MIRGSKEYWALLVVFLILYALYSIIKFVFQQRKKRQIIAYNETEVSYAKRTFKQQRVLEVDIELEERKRTSIIKKTVEGFKAIPMDRTDKITYNFTCSYCNFDNHVLLIYLERGDSEFALSSLVDPYHILSRWDIDHFKLAQRDSFRGAGLYIGSQPAIAKLSCCHQCETPYLLTFSAGEQQPSRNSFFIQGLWEIQKESAWSFKW